MKYEVYSVNKDEEVSGKRIYTEAALMQELSQLLSKMSEHNSDVKSVVVVNDFAVIYRCDTPLRVGGRQILFTQFSDGDAPDIKLTNYAFSDNDITMKDSVMSKLLEILYVKSVTFYDSKTGKFICSKQR